MTDNAKELLARAQNFVDRKYVAHSDKRQFAMGLGYVTAERQDLAEEMATFAADTLRLSARQQASVEDIATTLRSERDAILQDDSVLNMTDQDVGERLSRALLAKYDIFEKAEG